MRRSVDVSKCEWKKVVDQECEEVNIVVIPRHNKNACVKAKNIELEKLREFDTYEEVNDLEQI